MASISLHRFALSGSKRQIGSCILSDNRVDFNDKMYERMSSLIHLVNDGLLHRVSFFLSITLQLGVILRSLHSIFSLLALLSLPCVSIIPSAKADGLSSPFLQKD